MAIKIITDDIDKFIRAILRPTEDFRPNSIRYAQLDFDQGIWIAVGRLESLEAIDLAIQQVLFQKETHDFDSVKDWLIENKGIIWAQQDVDFSYEDSSLEFAHFPGKEGLKVEEFAKEIGGVPIFKVGTHNKNKFSLKDLQEIVSNFNKLREENASFQIPIKLGHDAMGESEKPAVGWMQNLRVVGKFILADFVDLSEKAFDLIKSKAFKNRSIELIPEFVDSTGKKIGRVIRGIALLGSSLPAVNLPEIQFLKIPETMLAFAKGQEVEIISIPTELLILDFDDRPLNFQGRPRTDVQTLILSKERFPTRQAAIEWARDKGFRVDKVDETEGSFRIRQRNPEEFRPGSFRTIDLTRGVQAVIGRPKQQSLRQDRDKKKFKEKKEVTMSEEKEAVEEETQEAEATKDADEETKEEVKEEKAEEAADEILEEESKEKIIQFSSEDIKKLALLNEFEDADDIVKALNDFKLLQKEKADQEEKFRAELDEKKTKKIDQFTNQLIQDNKVLPKHKPFINVLLHEIDNNEKVELVFADQHGKKEEKSLFEVLQDFLNDLPSLGLTKEVSKTNSSLGTDRQEALENFAKEEKVTIKDLDMNDYKKFLSKFDKIWKGE